MGAQFTDRPIGNLKSEDVPINKNKHSLKEKINTIKENPNPTKRK